jgi:penicillin-binding protein 1B
LTPERTLKRKFIEIFMAFLLENRATKDEILETYLNVIYMGQLGPFEIRGFGSAAKYYFGRELEDLKLGECALLATVIKGPGIYNPFRAPEKVLERRKFVLERMLELNLISDFDLKAALEIPLPKKPGLVLEDPAPFFVEAVRQKIIEMKIDMQSGLKIYTTLNVQAQKAAQEAVAAGINDLETRFKSLKAKKEKGMQLQGSLIAADPTTGFVEALVGGKDFKSSQFNRAIQSKRQIGSVIKPLVFLAALESATDMGKPYTPFSLLDDSKFKVKYEGQEWSPNNYENKYYGTVPMFYALRNSLNSATASLGLKIGLSEIIETASALGIVSGEVKELPSLTLGAVELSPYQVLQVYSTLARIGVRNELTLIRRLESPEGYVLYNHQPTSDQVVDPVATSVLVSMMEQVIENGTAKSVRRSGFLHPAAGKTGTTSDSKDSWFAGFTPLQAAVVWVGYDDNTPHGLSGSSGAVPIWTNYMKRYASQFPPINFSFSPETEKRKVDIPTQVALEVPDDPEKPMTEIELVFPKDFDPSESAGDVDSEN